MTKGKKEAKKIAIYSRKSRFTGKGESIGNQVELCREYIQRNYPDEALEMVEVFEDDTCIIGTNQSPARGRRFVPTFFVFSTLEAAKG